MGKFYELFEMDAHTAVETLGLSYMKVGGCGCIEVSVYILHITHITGWVVFLPAMAAVKTMGLLSDRIHGAAGSLGMHKVCCTSLPKATQQALAICLAHCVQGEKPHAGFPEAAYHQMAEKLARAGHKVSGWLGLEGMRSFACLVPGSRHQMEERRAYTGRCFCLPVGPLSECAPPCFSSLPGGGGADGDT